MSDAVSSLSKNEKLFEIFVYDSQNATFSKMFVYLLNAANSELSELVLSCLPRLPQPAQECILYGGITR